MYNYCYFKSNNPNQDIIDSILSYNEDELNKLLMDSEAKYLYGVINKDLLFVDYNEYSKLETLINASSNRIKELLYIITKKDIKQINIDTVRRTLLQYSMEYIERIYPIDYIDLKELIKRIKRLEIYKIKVKTLIDELKPFNKSISDKVKETIGTDVFIKLVSTSTDECVNIKDALKIIESDEAMYEYLKNDDTSLLITLAKLLSTPDTDIFEKNIIYSFSILDDEMLKRYIYLRNNKNIDLLLLGDDPYTDIGTTPIFNQTEIDNDWVINKELEDEIYKDMNNNYDILDIISHIYIKLSMLLKYNQRYLLNEYSLDYNKQVQEAINLDNNGVVCSEFSYLLAKLLNRIDGVEARCIKHNTFLHVYVSVIIKEYNIKICFDPGVVNDCLSDNARLRLGMKPISIDYVLDRYNLFKNSIDKVFGYLQSNNIINSEYNNNISSENPIIAISNYINSIRGLVSDNEFINSFNYYYKEGLFGDITYALVKSFRDNDIIIIIVLDNNYYKISSKTLYLELIDKEELDYRFYNYDYEYLDDEHRLPREKQKRI